MSDSIQPDKPEKSRDLESKNIDSNAEFLYSLTSDRLQSQLQQIESLDTREPEGQSSTGKARGGM